MIHNNDWKIKDTEAINKHNWYTHRNTDKQRDKNKKRCNDWSDTWKDIVEDRQKETEWLTATCTYKRQK